MKIFEVIDTKQGRTLESFVDALMPDCQRWFSELGGWDVALFELIMWRGINANFDSLATELPCPINRKPTMTPLDTHNICDQWFLERTGVRFRSNSFFCDPDKSVAATFGKPYIVIPKGEYKYCWSPEYADMTISLEKFGDEVIAAASRRNAKVDLADLSNSVYEFLNNGMYRTDRIEDALTGNGEIMLHCQEAYMIDPEFLRYLQ